MIPRTHTDRRTKNRRSETTAYSSHPRTRTPHPSSLRRLLHLDDSAARRILLFHLATFFAYELVGIGLSFFAHSDTATIWTWVMLGIFPFVHAVLLTALAISDFVHHRPNVAGARFAAACMIATFGLIISVTLMTVTLAVS